jgi:hypothetical protein
MDFTNKIIGETIMSHMYALARQLQAPGVKTTATFNPTRIIFPIFLKRLRERPFTIYDPFDFGKRIAFWFSCPLE